MEEKQNFLDILEAKLNELVEKGKLTEEEIRQGIEIDESWIYSSGIDRDIIISAMMEYMIRNDKNYLDNCERRQDTENMHIEAEENLIEIDPAKPSRIILVKRWDNVQIETIGNDNMTTLIITNYKNSRNQRLQLSPEEFCEQVYERVLARKEWDITKKAKTEINLEDVKSIISSFMDEQMKELMIERQETSLNEMSENLVEYCEYILEEEKKNNIIYAGYRNRPQVPGPKRTPANGESVGKKNENIPFEEREELLKSLNPIKPQIVFMNPKTERTGNIERSDIMYIFEDPTGEGYLMINEPYNGNERTRLVYLTNEKINDFLEYGETINNQFWEDVARHYIDMNDNDFRNEDRTYLMNHSDRENYLNSLKAIVEWKKEGKEKIKTNKSVQQRARIACARLYDGEKGPDIRQTVKNAVEYGEITPAALKEAALYLQSEQEQEHNKSEEEVEL